MEDKIARQRVREQIARDRAEKDAKFATARDEEQKRKTATQEANVEQQRADDIARAAANRETARLQFRLPDGSKILHQFPSSATLGEARQYVAEVRILTCCKRLAEIKRINSCGKWRRINSPASCSHHLSLELFIYVYFWNTDRTPRSGDVTSSSPQEPPQADHYNTMGARPKSSYARRRNPPQPEGGSIARQEGNIHRLNRDDDKDDENNTWNGNSTQQM
ncbi:putative UBX domain-containing protein 4 [Apostichopus japonicus]|uniref:UBX domain-containing protein 4 n=1 Tax=Stichopus japonicus TaxID=307972 RepID=A0A2G8LIY4_STIJA|nr:putative UBX domain-containing protein 4 [Apostichopus japonicus]